MSSPTEEAKKTKIGTVLWILSGIFGLIPGVSILVSGIGVPPENLLLFSGSIQATGSFALFAIWYWRSSVQKKNPRNIFICAISLFVLSFVAIFLYMALFNNCVISHPTNHTVLFPLWSNGELEMLINKAGGRYEALARYGYYGVYQATQKDNFSLSLTIFIMLIVYQAIFTLLTMAFGLLAARKKVSFFGLNA